VLDPTILLEAYIVTATPDHNCWIGSADYATASCSYLTTASPYDWMLFDGAHKFRTLVKYDLTGAGLGGHIVPSDAQVLNAQLLMLPVGATDDGVVEPHKITWPWDGTATWNNSSTGVAWPANPGDLAGGGTFDPLQSGDQMGFHRSDAWYEWRITRLVKGWLGDPATNQGVLLKLNDEESISRTELFYGAQDPNSAPRLYIWYRAAPIGARPSDTFFSQRLNDRSSASVNLATGNLLLANTDLHIAGPAGMDLAVNRYYNSRADNSPAGYTTPNLGNRWLTDAALDVALYNYGDSVYTFLGPSGYALTFVGGMLNGSPTGPYVAATGSNATLTINADTTKTVTFNRTGEVYRFLNDVLVSHEDRNGNKITFGYNGALLSSLSDTHGTPGRQVTVHSDTLGRIDSLKDPGPAGVGTERTQTYDYDGAGNLWHYTAPDGVGDQTTYAYDPTTKDLTQITDGVGHITRFTYVSLGLNRGRAVETLTRVNPGLAGDSIWRFAYADAPGGSCPSAGRITTVTDPINNQTIYCSNATGSVVKTIDGRSNVNTTTLNANFDQTQAVSGTLATIGAVYDGQNRLTEVDEAAGSKLFSTYTDPATGHAFLPTTFTDAQSLLTNTLYDGPGNVCAFSRAPAATAVRPTSCTDRSQPDTVTIERNVADGTVKSVTDGRTMKTSYGYDPTTHDLTSITPPPGSVRAPVSYVYDGLSRVTSYTDGKGQTTSYIYDALDRVKKITYQDTTHVDFSYDNAGNLLTRTDAVLQITYTPDALNRLVSEVFSDGRTPNSYVYDAAGNLRDLTDAGGTVAYHYDAANNVDTVTEPGSFLYQSVLTYNADNALATVQLAGPSGASQPGPVTITRTYTSGRLGEIKAVDNTVPASPVVLTDFVYCFRMPATGCDGTPSGTVTDLVQRIKDVNRNDTSVFSYLKLNQLTDVIVSGTDPATYHYTYDASGNRATRTVGATTNYTYDPGNVLQSAAVSGGATTTYTSDAIGNLTDSSAGLHMVYNKANQTTSVTPPGGAAIGMTYTGPGQGERLSHGALTFTTNILGVGVQKNGSTTSYYTRLPDGTLLGERVVNGSGTSRYYYLADAAGSVARLIDPAGAKKNNYRYDPFGNLLLSTGTVSNPFKFAGEYQDPDASGLYKIGERYYDPGLGRWTQPDPLATIGAYAYAGNDPINLIDPSGLSITGWIARGFEAFATTVSCVTAETIVTAGFCAVGVGSLIASNANTPGSGPGGFLASYAGNIASCASGSFVACGAGSLGLIGSGMQLTPQSQRGRRAPAPVRPSRATLCRGTLRGGPLC
jgi:RHS repeat-associated protein